LIPAEAYAPLSEPEFEIFRKEIDDAIDITVTLPAWPFREDRGNVDAFEFEMLFSWDFPVVLQSLAATHGDSYVTMLSVDSFGELIRPIWRITISPNMAGPYGFAHYREPELDAGDKQSPLNVVAERVAIVGSSGSWSVWADRDWELGLVHSHIVGGPWLNQTLIPFTATADPPPRMPEPASSPTCESGGPFPGKLVHSKRAERTIEAGRM
jgi:hypothetical protein